jgi:hypothetical protein
MVALMSMVFLTPVAGFAAATDLEQAQSKSKKYTDNGFEKYKTFCVCLDGSADRNNGLGVINQTTPQLLNGSNWIRVRCDVLRFDPVTNQEQGSDHCFGSWVPLAK